MAPSPNQRRRPRPRTKQISEKQHEEDVPLRTINSSGGQPEYVWVSMDLIEASLSSRKLKVRQRNRAEDHWGWCRALVNSRVSHVPISNHSSLRNSQPQASWRGSPEKDSAAISISITVDDDIFASPELNGSSVQLTYNTNDDVVFQANTWWGNTATGQTSHSPNDLTSLEQLHEPAVIFCLQRRYEEEMIYTYTGKILLALNPFRPLDLYGNVIMRRYWRSSEGETGRPDPHIYAIAEDAYRSAIESIRSSSKPQDQSILVSGESGAGKTVTTKIILQYFAVLSQQADSNIAGIETKVLESNPILESFGNARTIRNDNSSRFGKFMEMRFDSRGCLLSASIQTYLLEKVRLISQGFGERNYHVFYEVLAGLTASERRDLHLSNRSARDFKMTCISETFDRRDGVHDRETYLELRTALDTVGFTAQEQLDLFTVVSALLYTSNLTFHQENEDASSIDEQNAALPFAVDLLGVDYEVLNAAMCTCAIEAGGETLYKQLSIYKAQKALEALIKTTYSALFMHIVRKVNSFIALRENFEPTNGKLRVSIGVLDIFGFESFERNSFEQLCINYCNEALQQQFNRFVFKLEQEEYKREGIDWSLISFPDNQDVLDLIEKRHNGILAILDEQSRLPRCTDASFANAVYQKCKKSSRLSVTKAMEACSSFAIHHFAGSVEYDTDSFLEKNKDELPKETKLLLKSSAFPFLARLGLELTDFPVSTTALSPSAISQGRQPRQIQRVASSIMHETVGSQFCNQLKQLRSRIEATSPHYVRCLKPNDELLPHSFNALVIADQLRCAGVLEAIRVSRIGFPHRYGHSQFVHRYELLQKSVVARQSKFGANPRDICYDLVECLTAQVAEYQDAEHAESQIALLGIQVGKSKVFIRGSSYETLEILRNKKILVSVTKIQAAFRMFAQRIEYQITIYALTLIQKFIRQIGAYRKMKLVRKNNAIGVIQRSYRCYQARTTLKAARKISIWTQSAHRGAVARQYCAFLFLDEKASIIQKAWRLHSKTSSSIFRRLRRCTITLQNHFRARKSRRLLWKLRKEARDLALVAAERDQFKEESRRLRQELNDAKKRAIEMPPMEPVPNQDPEIEKLRLEVQELCGQLDNAQNTTTMPSRSAFEEAQGLADALHRKEEELKQLRREIALLRTRDDMTDSVKSILVDTRFRESLPYHQSPHHRASPARSDVSLLDNEIEHEIDNDDVSSLTSFIHHDSGGDDLKRLHFAIRHRVHKQIDQILADTAEACVLVNQGDQYGRTAIHLAALSQDREIAEKLVDKGAVVNAQDDDGETPIHLAETSKMVTYLLRECKANPNIPNVDGICTLHLAVQRRDLDSVRALVTNNANVNNADNIRWFTALHLIALPSTKDNKTNGVDSNRCRIAGLLTGDFGNASQADLNYQDVEGNSPLHYAAQLDDSDAAELVKLFLQNDADPNLRNSRDQAPLHLLCHNDKLRKNPSVFRDAINCLLIHGADVNLPSKTGCTSLHLCLYHRDVDTAVQLVQAGAQLHSLWKKPKKWVSFWQSKEEQVLALDMVEHQHDLDRILSGISRRQHHAPPRRCCMGCKANLRSFSRTVHCGHCARLLCKKCVSSCRHEAFFPKYCKVTESSWVCSTCERVLLSQKEGISVAATHPTSSCGEDDDCYSC